MMDEDLARNWPPPPYALQVERVIDPFTQQPAVGMVRHPGYFFEASRPDRESDEAWQQIGIDYLAALRGVLPKDLALFTPAVLERLNRPRSAKNDPTFGWLAVSWPPTVGQHETLQAPNDEGPLGSFWASRSGYGLPRTLVALAGNVHQYAWLRAGNHVGLRIVMHVFDKAVQVHGVTLCGLGGNRALEATPAWWSKILLKGKVNETLLGQIRRAIGTALSTDQGDQSLNVWIDALETVPESSNAGRVVAGGFELRWRQSRVLPSKPAAPNRARVYRFRVELDVRPEAHSADVVRVHSHRYVGSAASVRVRSFLSDPASQGGVHERTRRRPTRIEDDLKDFMSHVDVELDTSRTLRHLDDSGRVLFETRSASPVASLNATLAVNDGTAPGRGVVKAGPSGALKPFLFSDQQGSIETHQRATELFMRFKAFGIEPQTYFRFARLPLAQRARAAVLFAPDGDLPNAEVRPFIGDPQADDPARTPSISGRAQLLVKYGSASPFHRRRLRLVDSNGRERERSKAQYLSVASDPRWAWHEFGHVLNFACTGELEFPFAHGAGDALGAIVSDPLSALAPGDAPEAPARFESFPWIEVPGRSHGRQADLGYSWCGCRNLVRLDFSEPTGRYAHSYFGEQLLSSSLFRLYRCLGGDTRLPRSRRTNRDAKPKAWDPDTLVRLEAADYCVYLIMRAISLLGPDSIAPARTAEQFVAALIDADLGTGPWEIDAKWPQLPGLPPRPQMRRQGGRVHKVIRWAFEQQGLYATEDPTETAEGPGRPPPVDVFIADRRGDRGGYDPAPLRCTQDERWHARPEWLRRDGGDVVVLVANRGAKPAGRVTLRVWWSTGTLLGACEEVRWCDQPIEGTLELLGTEPSPCRVSLPATWDEPTWVLASVDAPADRSNLLLGERPPTHPNELLELVAHDNNLALAHLL